MYENTETEKDFSADFAALESQTYDASPAALAEDDELTPEDEATLNGLIEQANEPQRLDWGHKAQRELLSLLVCDETFLASSALILRPEYFTDEAHRIIAAAAHDHHAAFNALPSQTVLLQEVEDRAAKRGPSIQLRAPSELRAVYRVYPSGLNSRAYYEQRLRKFVRNQRLQIEVKALLDTLKRDESDEAYARIRDGIAKACEPIGNDGDEPVKLIEFRDLRAKLGDTPRTNWVVPNYLAAGQTTLLVGREKLGKSTLNYAAAGALVTGENWLGTVPVADVRAVVYVNLENPDAAFVDDVASQMREGADFKCPLLVPSRWPEVITAETVAQLLDDAGLQHDPDGLPIVVFIDTCRSAFGNLFPAASEWENNQAAVKHAIRPLAQLAKERNLAIGLVHHANKQGQSSGSTFWGGVVDYIVTYTRIGDEDSPLRRVSSKGRYRGIDAPKDFAVRMTADGRLRFAGDPDEALLDEMTEEVSATLAVQLKAFPGADDAPVSMAEIARRTGKDRSTIGRWVTSLVGKGLVERGETDKRVRRTPDGDVKLGGLILLHGNAAT